MLQGIISKGYSGFYYVNAEGKLWECSLRGRFRVRSQDFLPGDRVNITPLTGDKGVIEEVLPRRNILVRPSIANVDQAVIVFAVKSPEPDFNLLDRILVQVESAKVTPLICFNKSDMLEEEELNELIRPYRQIGYQVHNVSAKFGLGINELRKALCKKISVMAGPSGVGKSSLVNAIQPGLQLQAGEVSQKLRRGRHTTRHVELMPLNGGGFVADTPGFSALNIPVMAREELALFFPEMLELANECKFNSCLHWQEPKCAIKEAVDMGNIDMRRYQNYLFFLQEVIANERRY